MLEVGFPLHAFDSLKEFTARHDVIVVGNLNQWVHVLNVHDCLVNLLPGQHISGLRVINGDINFCFINAT